MRRPRAGRLLAAEVDVVRGGPGEVHVVLVLGHHGQQLGELQDPHALDVEVGDGGGHVARPHETEAREIRVIAGLRNGTIDIVLHLVCL